MPSEIDGNTTPEDIWAFEFLQILSRYTQVQSFRKI